jgi:hypothetical protein
MTATTMIARASAIASSLGSRLDALRESYKWLSVRATKNLLKKGPFAFESSGF